MVAQYRWRRYARRTSASFRCGWTRPEGRDIGMAMAASEIEALIKAALPDARVTVEDLAGDGDHYAATVVSETFRGIPRVKQHQIVYAALRGRMGGELHALALQTSAPTQ